MAHDCNSTNNQTEKLDTNLLQSLGTGTAHHCIAEIGKLGLKPDVRRSGSFHDKIPLQLRVDGVGGGVADRRNSHADARAASSCDGSPAADSLPITSSVCRGVAVSHSNEPAFAWGSSLSSASFVIGDSQGSIETSLPSLGAGRWASVMPPSGVQQSHECLEKAVAAKPKPRTSPQTARLLVLRQALRRKNFRPDQS